MKYFAKTLYIAIISVTAVCVAPACSKAPAAQTPAPQDSLSNLSGQWQREIVDSEIGVTGNETMLLNADSTFVLANNLTLEYADSTLQCSMSFITDIKGSWQIEDKQIRLNIDSSTFNLDTIGCQRQAIDLRTGKSVDADIAADIYGRLKESLSQLYFTSYSELPQIEIDGCVISGNLLNGTCGQTDITWTKL